MMSNRPYRRSLSLEETLQELKMNIDIKYDREIVEALLCIIRENEFNFNKYGLS